MQLAVNLLGYAPPARPWHGDYCAGILPALLASPEVTRATLLVTPYGHRQWQHLASERVSLQLVEGLDERKRRRFYAERYILPGMLRELHADAVFAPLGGALLQPGARYVYRLASLAYLEEPERFSLLEQLFYGKTIPASCKAAGAVLVDHAALAGSAANRNMTSRELIHVVAPGTDLHAGTAPEALHGEEQGIDGELGHDHEPELPRATISGKYIVCLVGESDPQQPRLVSGLLQHARLPRDWEYATVICLGGQAGNVKGPRLLAIEDAPPEVYWSLLHGASAALCLSTSDSGLTALRHAQDAGLPVIAAETAATRAVAGEAAVYVPPSELADTASALAVLLADDKQRSELGALARKRSEAQTWDAAAQNVLKLLQA